MATERVVRASDSDREQAVEVLRGQFAEGRLTLEEFDERASAAYTAKTWADLRALTSDLPVRLGFETAPASVVPGPVAAVSSARPGAWRFAPLIPMAFVLLVLANAGGWHHHHDGVFPFFPVIPLAIFGAMFGLWLRAARRHRQ